MSSLFLFFAFLLFLPLFTLLICVFFRRQTLLLFIVVKYEIASLLWTDIDECLSVNKCDNDTKASCINSPGTYRCVCNSPAYIGTYPNCGGKLVTTVNFCCFFAKHCNLMSMVSWDWVWIQTLVRLAITAFQLLPLLAVVFMSNCAEGFLANGQWRAIKVVLKC